MVINFITSDTNFLGQGHLFPSIFMPILIFLGCNVQRWTEGSILIQILRKMPISAHFAQKLSMSADFGTKVTNLKENVGSRPEYGKNRI